MYKTRATNNFTHATWSCRILLHKTHATNNLYPFIICYIDALTSYRLFYDVISCVLYDDYFKDENMHSVNIILWHSERTTKTNQSISPFRKHLCGRT